jgi:hypothetical protein
MRSWYEGFRFGRQKADELIRSAEEIRRGARAARCARRAGAVRTIRARLVLHRGEAISFRVGRRPLLVRCLAGVLWATVDPDPRDTVLEPLQEILFEGGGHVVLEAVRTSTVCLESEPAVRLSLGLTGDLDLRMA